MNMDTALARNTDPETSHIAAACVDVTKREAEVIETMKAHGNLTAPEIAQHLGISRDSVSPRMKPLVRKGRVIATDERRGGCTVWRLA